MVLSPSELEKRIMEEEEDKLEKIEEHIDYYLIWNYTGQKAHVPLYNNGDFNVREFTLNKLLAQYNRAGWRTKIDYNSQGTRYIEFTRYKPERKEQKKSNYNLPDPDVSSFNK